MKISLLLAILCQIPGTMGNGNDPPARTIHLEFSDKNIISPNSGRGVKYLLTDAFSQAYNLTMDKTMAGLIFSLFDIALSQEMPFRQPQYIQCMYHGLVFVLLW